MPETHFFPARDNEFGYIIIDLTDDGKAMLERHPLIGFATQISESRFHKIIVQTRPVCTVGDNLTPDFIPGIGLVDDAVVLGMVWKMVQEEVEKFMESKRRYFPE